MMAKDPRQTPPDITVSTREDAPADAMRHGEIESADAIIRARLAGDVYATDRLPLRLRNPLLKVRWFNSAVSADRIWRARYQQGWLPVTPDLLADPGQLGQLQTNGSGYVVRGDRGQEVLMYMPLARYNDLQARKTEENDQRLGLRSERQAREHVQDRLGQQGHERAAEFVRSRVVGSIVDSRERIDQPPEDAVSYGQTDDHEAREGETPRGRPER